MYAANGTAIALLFVVRAAGTRYGSVIMSDQRNHGRENTHDTGSPGARPRDDLRTGSKKKKPHDERDEGRDREEDKEKVDGDKDDEKTAEHKVN